MKNVTGKWTAVIIAAFAPPIGMACSPPVDTAPFEQRVLREFCASDVVFIGQVNAQLRLGEYVIEHEVRPIVGFKGVTLHRNVRPKFLLTTGNSCDIDYIKGSTYLFFAHSDQNSGRIVPRLSTAPLGRSGLTRAELEKIAESPDLCSTEHAAENAVLPIAA